MDTSVHLISMPMAYPMNPSCQLGILHSYLDSKYGERISINSYSAFLEILYDFAGEHLNEFFLKYKEIGEQIFLLAYLCSEFGENSKEFESALRGYNHYYANNKELRVSKKTIRALTNSVESYLDQVVLPALTTSKLNVVGFSTTFMQVFASVFAAKYLQRSSTQILFIFGGSSMALPEASKLLALAGIEGLIITGPGEIPLGKILDHCLESTLPSSGEIVESIDSKKFINVARIGSQLKQVHYSSSQDFLKSSRFPNYDEYFEKWRLICADDEAYQVLTSGRLIGLPLAGSRGCFAKCDFCQIPNITTRFATLEGKEVFNRTVELSEKYGIKNIVFIDSVCNTWVEDYADTMLAMNMKFCAFMEMRVHCEESTWTKLSLAGVQELQLGIEALSDPLLKNMRKGTTAMQNLKASKYVAELGMGNQSNLITYHPRSDVEDVKETKRIFSLTTHFLRLNLSEFVVSYGSPIYNNLSEEQRSWCRKGFRWLPSTIQEMSFPRALSYEYPREWLSPDIVAAWDEFHAWHEKEMKKEKPVFHVTKTRDGEISFLDTRSGKKEEFLLCGDAARIFDCCHAGRTSQQVGKLCGLDDGVVTKILLDLVDQGLLVNIGNQFLSLALRSRDELIKNLCRNKQ